MKKHMIKQPHILLLAAIFLLAGCSVLRQQTETATNPSDAALPAPVSEREALESTAMLIEGSRQKMLGNEARAISLFHQATQKDPTNDAAFYELAMLHAMAGEMEDAESLMKKALALSPGNLHYQMAMADIFILSDRLPDAIAVYETQTGAHPEDINIHQKLAYAYAYNKQYNQAIAVLNHMETLTGPSLETGMQKQRIWINQEAYDEAIAEAENLLGFYPNESMLLELLGDLYMETGQAEKAAEVFEGLLENNPDNYMAMLLLADVYQEKGEEQRAFSMLLEAFEHQEMDMEGKVRVIYSYMRMSENNPHYLQWAQELSEVVTDSHPNEAEVHLIRGDIEMFADNIDAAREAYLKGINMDPSNLSVWRQILGLDLQLQDFEAMRNHADMALEYYFEQPVLFLFAGLAHLQLKDYEEAASLLEHGLSLAVADEDLRQDLLSMLGDTYFQLDVHDMSDDYYQRALEINPENATVLNNFSYHLALRKERLEEALEMSKKANRLDLDNPAFQDTQGWILYQMGNYQQAEQWIRQALNNSPEPSPAILEHYGDVLYKLGKSEDALLYWKKADAAGEGSLWLHKKISEGTLYE